MIRTVASRLQNIHFHTPFERPLPHGETAQAPELGCFSTTQDKIWCVNVTLVDVASYKILFRLVQEPLSHKVFIFLQILTAVGVKRGKHQGLGSHDQSGGDRPWW